MIHPRIFPVSARTYVFLAALLLVAAILVAFFGQVGHRVHLNLELVLVAAAMLALVVIARLRASKRALEEEIRKRRQVEEELIEKRNLLQTIIQTEPECVKLLAPDSRIVEMNPAGAALIDADSPDAVRGRSVYDFIAPQHHQAHQELAERVFRGESGTLEFQAISFKGRTKWFETHAVPMRDGRGAIVSLLAITRDVTARKEAEEQARRQQADLMRVCRMVTVNEMATTLAHELNQPLLAILSYTEAFVQLMDHGAERGELARIAEKVAEQAERAGKIVQRVRQLGGSHEGDTQPLDINAVIDDVRELASADARSRGIELRLEFERALPRVMADPIQIQQVVLNLVRNAIEAMDGAAAPRVTIRTARGPDRVEVSVTDNGVGLAPEAAERAFESFYTTKPGGMGMGLAISRTIIDAHGGELRLMPNAEGRGTTACFSLPIQV